MMQTRTHRHCLFMRLTGSVHLVRSLLLQGFGRFSRSNQIQPSANVFVGLWTLLFILLGMDWPLTPCLVPFCCSGESTSTNRQIFISIYHCLHYIGDCLHFEYGRFRSLNAKFRTELLNGERLLRFGTSGAAVIWWVLKADCRLFLAALCRS
jgi:hypothetical protein